MQDHPLLSQVVLGYSAVIDRHRAVVATRLTVAPVQAEAALDGAGLMELLGEIWPETAGALSLQLHAVWSCCSPAALTRASPGTPATPSPAPRK